MWVRGCLAFGVRAGFGERDVEGLAVAEVGGQRVDVPCADGKSVVCDHEQLRAIRIGVEG